MGGIRMPASRFTEGPSLLMDVAKGKVIDGYLSDHTAPGLKLSPAPSLESKQRVRLPILKYHGDDFLKILCQLIDALSLTVSTGETRDIASEQTGF